MARFYDTTYDPAKDSGTSGAEISDINPEQAYDVDLRRLEMDKSCLLYTSDAADE